jgi:hypothetical protein
MLERFLQIASCSLIPVNNIYLIRSSRRYEKVTKSKYLSTIDPKYCQALRTQVIGVTDRSLMCRRSPTSPRSRGSGVAGGEFYNHFCIDNRFTMCENWNK